MNASSKVEALASIVEVKTFARESARLPFEYDMLTGTGRYDSFFIRLSMRAQDLDPFQAQVSYTLRDANTNVILARYAHS